MQFGYPAKIKIADLYDKLEPTLEPRQTSMGKHMCCSVLLLASGFEPKDLRMGDTEIHIRPGHSQLLDQIHCEIKESSVELAKRFKKGFEAHMRRRRVILLRIRFIGRR